MIKKRKKNTRHRGTHTHGGGAKKKGRGKGHRGGVGNSGSGKRSDQKKSRYINEFGKFYFGKSKRIAKKPVTKLKTLNLCQIQDKFSGQKEANLKGYKILSQGELKEKIVIKASAASKSAIDKVKKAGGDIIVA